MREERREQSGSERAEKPAGADGVDARFALLAECTTRLLRSARPAAEVEELARLVAGGLGCEVSIGYLLEPAGDRLRLAWSIGLDASQVDRLGSLDLGENVCGRVAKTRTGLVVGRDEPRRTEPLRLLALSCFASFPLEVDGRLLGTIAFGRRQGAWFDEADLALLAALAASAAAALERSRVVEESERRAAAGERRFRRVVEHVQDALMVDDLAGRVVFANERFCELFGIPYGELSGVVLEDYVAPEYRDELRRRHDLRVSGEPVPDHFEYEGVRRDGSRLWLEVDVVPVRDERGTIVGTQSAMRDISARRRIERALRETVERLRLVQQAAQLGAWDYDIVHGTVVWSGQYPPIFGDERRGRVSFERVLDQVHPADRERWRRDVEAALDPRAGGTFDGEYRVLWLGGGTRWISGRGRVYFEGEGAARRAVRFVGVAQDVTARREAEEALREAERVARDRFAELEQIYRYAPVGLFTLDRDYLVTRINERMAKINGVPPERHLGRAVAEIVPELADHLMETYRPVLERGETLLDVAHHGSTPAAPGVERDWLGSYFPLRSGNGEVVGLIGAVLEVTDLRRAEEELRRSRDELEERVAERTAALAGAHERLRSLSRRLIEVQEAERRAVARELHDEAGQALTALQLTIAAFERGQCAACAGVEAVGELKRVVGRIMEDLHALSVRLRPAALDRLGLAGALRALGDTPGPVPIAVEASGVEGRALPVELESTVYRVVQEAVTNVLRHSQARHGSVLVACDDRRIVAVVDDDGRGFHPDEGLASGRVGLLGMQERAELLGGRLDIESAPGAGTTVRLELPMDAQRR